MLYELHAAMLQTLEDCHATDNVIAAYKKRWDETVEGIRRSFPCPACFVAGVEDSELKPLPSKGNKYYVACKTCGREYSFEAA